MADSIVIVSVPVMRILESHSKGFESGNYVISRLLGGPVRKKKQDCRVRVTPELMEFLRGKATRNETLDQTIERLLKEKGIRVATLS